MSTYKNLMTVCAAVVLAFGLAACGSSDDDTAADDGAPTVETPAGPTQAELDAEKARADKAEKELAETAAAAMMAKARKLKGALASEVVSPTGDERANIYTGTGITVTATHGAASKAVVQTGETPANLNPAFAADGDADDIGGGWSGTRLTRSDPTNTDEMIVYTDITAPAGRPFISVYEDDPLTVGTDATKRAAAVEFPTSGRQVTFDANADSDDAGSVPDIVQIMGTWQGAAGAFRCNPATNACTVRGTNEGLVFEGGESGEGWSFDANAGAMVSVADTMYMHFGWWLREAKSDGALTVEMFAGGNAEFPNDDVNDVTGKATYEGRAAGKFSIEAAPGGDPMAGHWTAMAMLEADFGADNAGGTIKGAISDFTAAGYEVDWKVDLNSIDIAGAADAPDFAGGNTAWTIGGEKAAAGGEWEGDFYNTLRRNDGAPTGVAGTFSTVYGSVGEMDGAFGAHNTTPDATPK